MKLAETIPQMLIKDSPTSLVTLSGIKTADPKTVYPLDAWQRFCQYWPRDCNLTAKTRQTHKLAIKLHSLGQYWQNLCPASKGMKP